MYAKTIAMLLALLLAMLTFGLPLTAQEGTPNSDDNLQAALDVANAFEGKNADWQALYPEGFRYTFEDDVTMVLVPAGCFMMGSDYTHTVFSADQMQDERPAHEQCFDMPFWIDLTEVMQGDFDRLGGVSAREDFTASEQHPVARVSWFEAGDFCALRDARLPTEAEWEYAARGVDSLVYPWGNEIVARNAARQSNFITDVGTIPAGASWVGALDMSGNVWEWTSSLIMPYPYDAEDGREDDTAETAAGRRVVRGGVAENNARILLRSSSRFSIPADAWDSITGLRCVRSLETSAR